MGSGDLAGPGRDRALAILRESAAPQGIVASAAWEHYAALWTRDFAFSAYGALASQDPSLTDAVKRSLLSAAAIQAENGQIPNAAWFDRDSEKVSYFDFGEAASTDATLLFIIAAGEYLDAVPDEALRERLWPALTAARNWAGYQDANQFRLVDSVEGGDWMESSLVRSGKVFYNNVLYVRALELLARHAPDGREEDSFRRLHDDVKERVNCLFWPRAGLDYAYFTAWFQDKSAAGAAFPHPASPAAYAAAIRTGREHYLSHIKWGQFVDECDVLANVMAVLYGVSDEGRSRQIMGYLHRSPAVHPFPARTYPRNFPADDLSGMYKQGSDRYQGEQWRNPPGRYHNGGVWPFIGGFYVAALVRVGMYSEAVAELDRLAQANRLATQGEWGFHEWLDASTGEPGGAPGQTWSAATFVLASAAVSARRVPILCSA